mmetsp:Transcript_4025/g.9860  ORF Transcript_4025/g.9860 Transcript_4025/m.9860 type:complete len:499 (+) Transcript_4025:268-1764(+)
MTLRVATSGMFSLLISLLAVMGEGDGHSEHAGHEHTDHASSSLWEWAGLFDLHDDWYVWTAQKRDLGNKTAYAYAHMKLVVVEATGGNEADLHALETVAEHALEAACTEVDPNTVITPKADGCYELHFDDDAWQSLFKLNATAVHNVAIFLEHLPSEFEADSHYLKDAEGVDVEPVHVLPELSSHIDEEQVTWPSPWGAVIAASLSVNVVTLSGVIFLSPFVKGHRDNFRDTFDAVTSALAAGAILATAIFLLLFESTHYVATGWNDEAEANWRWGTLVICGFVFPSVVDALAIGFVGRLELRAPCPDSTDTENPVKVVETTRKASSRVLVGVLLGDFMHNLCDGFFIGAAFRYCGHSRGWAIALTAMIHEVAQELADYILLTGKGNLKPALALGINFLSGCSVLLGGIIILCVDISASAIGLILAFSGGLFIHIACTEAMPIVYERANSVASRAMCLFAFALGATLVGLVLLDHSHCSVSPPSALVTSPDTHDGHGH